ncbi:MAG: adenylyltransferase/cytidyltransferase family protein, partial [Gammaproteobacteria bacterium]|nr:adenylyltransferase/cytidyltransferase family protein [Gammaproteobacteria bacterium]
MDIALNTQQKIFARDSLFERLQSLPRPLVFTNGCFDILHRGHTTYLEQSRNLGAALIVAVNTDESVQRQNKGDGRPINSLADRMSVLASLACVDAVTSFDEDTPLDLIEQILPDHLVKGGDWHLKDIVGATEVEQNGGKVHSLQFKFDLST